MNDSSRRSFIKKLTGSTAAMAIGTSVLAGDQKEQYLEFLSRTKYSANDNINIALIGAGIMGTQDTTTALTVPGAKMVAVCDLYEGRLKDAKTKWGSDIFTTRSYTELLNRKY